MKIGIIGTGAYAIAIASLLENKNFNIMMWTKLHDEYEDLIKNHKNSKIINYQLDKKNKFTMSLETLFSGAIGSIIAILASFGMFMLKEYNDSKKCIKAIKAEIQCLKNLCSLVFDNVITLDETPLNLCYPLDTDYFTIFNHNSSEIGRISNDKDRELIVAIYIAANPPIPTFSPR